MSWLSGFGKLRRLKSRAWALPRMARGLGLFVPMLRDVLAGRYRPVPWKAFGLMAASIAYLLMPFDLIPDVILLFGVFDDVLIIGWLLGRMDTALAPYRAWRDGTLPPE